MTHIGYTTLKGNNYLDHLCLQRGAFTRVPDAAVPRVNAPRCTSSKCLKPGSAGVGPSAEAAGCMAYGLYLNATAALWYLSQFHRVTAAAAAAAANVAAETADSVLSAGELLPLIGAVVGIRDGRPEVDGGPDEVPLTAATAASRLPVNSEDEESRATSDAEDGLDNLPITQKTRPQKWLRRLPVGHTKWRPSIVVKY